MPSRTENNQNIKDFMTVPEKITGKMKSIDQQGSKHNNKNTNMIKEAHASGAKPKNCKSTKEQTLSPEVKKWNPPSKRVASARSPLEENPGKKQKENKESPSEETSGNKQQENNVSAEIDDTDNENQERK